VDGEEAMEEAGEADGEEEDSVEVDGVEEDGEDHGGDTSLIYIHIMFSKYTIAYIF
jgi:hypothetical protein